MRKCPKALGLTARVIGGRGRRSRDRYPPPGETVSGDSQGALLRETPEAEDVNRAEFPGHGPDEGRSGLLRMLD